LFQGVVKDDVSDSLEFVRQATSLSLAFGACPVMKFATSRQPARLWRSALEIVKVILISSTCKTAQILKLDSGENQASVRDGFDGQF